MSFLRDLSVRIGFQVDTEALSSLDRIIKGLGTSMEQTAGHVGKAAADAAKAFSASFSGLGGAAKEAGKALGEVGKEGAKAAFDIDAALGKVQEKLAVIDRQASLLGHSFDAAKERATVVADAIKEIAKEQKALDHPDLGALKKYYETFTGQGAAGFQAAMAGVGKELNAIDQQARLFGHSFDVAKEKANLLAAEIKRLTNAGVPAHDEHLQALAAQHAQLSKGNLGTQVLGLGIGSKAMDAAVASSQRFDEFQQTMQRAGARMLAVGPQIKQMQDQALEQAGKLGRSPRDLATIDLELSNRGFNPKQVQQMMPVVAKLAKVGGTDTQTSAELLDVTQKSYFKGDPKNAGHVADVLARTHVSGGVSFAELAETQRVAAPAFAALGQSLETQMTLTAMLGQVGVKGAAAGTALKTLLAKVSSTDSLKLDENTKVNTTNGAGARRPMTEVLQDVFNAARSKSPDQKQQIFANAFGADNATTVSGLANLAPTQSGAIGRDIKHSSGTLDHMTEILDQGVNPAWDRMSSKAEVFADLILARAAPSMAKFVDGIGFFLDKGSELVRWFNSVTENSRMFSERVSGIKIVLEALAIGIGAAALTSLTIALWSAAAAAIAMLIPFAPLIMGVSLLAGAGLLLWDAISWMNGGDSEFGAFWDGLASHINGFIDVIHGTVPATEWAWTTMADIVNTCIEEIMWPINVLTSGISSLIAMAARLPAITSFFKSAMDAGKGFIGWAPSPQAAPGGSSYNIHGINQTFNMSPSNGADPRALGDAAAKGTRSGIGQAIGASYRAVKGSTR